MTTQDKKQFVPETLSTWEGERLYLTLSLPEGSEELFEFHRDDEYDFGVPDAVIRMDVEHMIDALEVLQHHPTTFRSVTVHCSIESDGYEGKLRGSHIVICTSHNLI